MTDYEIDTLAEKVYEYGRLHQKLVSADAIVALGNMDIRIAKKAAELWHKALAPVVVVSGGVGRLTPASWSKPEAVMFAEQLYKECVPQSSIIIEDKSTNVPENLSFTLVALKAAGINPKRLILVTSPFAERRVMALCRRQFPAVEMELTSPNLTYSEFPNDMVDSVETIHLVVGELERLNKYPAKGFTAAEEIPQAILDAASSLLEAGFNKYRII